MMTPENTAPTGYARLGMSGAAFAILGIFGLAAGAVSAHNDPGLLKNVFQSYLYGWVVAMLLCLGCYGFMLVHYMSRGSWGKPVIRLFEAGAKTLPLMLLLFVPLLVWPGALYPWANPDLVHGNAALGIKADATLLHRAPYMNPAMFAFRTLAYFGIWALFTTILTNLSLRQDKTGDEGLADFRQKMSTFGFVIYVVTSTLAFTDWVMSLDTHWFSTLHGFWFVDFQGLAAIAFVSLIVCRYKMAHQEPYDSLVDQQVTRDLGNLLLTLTMIWGYFSLSQWIIMWSGNLPEEIAFYLRRNSGTFLLIGAANILFSFFAPFVMLLSGNTKRTPQLLAMVSILVLIMRLVDIFWIVVPVTRHPIQFLLTDAAGAVFAIGAFLAGFSYLVRQVAIIPRHEPVIAQEAAAHG